MIPPTGSANDEPARGLRFGFSTLGCPDLDLAGVRALAARAGFWNIEIRCLGGSLDFVGQLARFPGGAAGARDFLLASNIRVALVGSSFKLTRSPVAQRLSLLAEAESGEALGASWVRVFGGGPWGEPLTAESIATASEHRAWWAEVRAARGWHIDLLLENHDALSGSTELLAFLDHTGGPMPVLWDTHHTWKVAGEAPADSWARLRDQVRHVHLKDSISQPSDNLPYTYVVPGTGEFPLQETLSLLSQAGFGGVVSLEWEKQWRPSLAALEFVLPDWNRCIATYQELQR